MVKAYLNMLDSDKSDNIRVGRLKVLHTLFWQGIL
jgi:hypothetical protein